MRLLVVTARYPTEDRPAAGVFVRDRLADPVLRVTVVAPRSYGGSRWGRFLRLCWTAWTARGRFDGVEGHFVLPTGPVALIAARLRGIPFVVVAHGSDVRGVDEASRLRRWLARRVIRGAAVVVANSATTAADVARLGVAAVVIPPGVDRTRFVPSRRPANRRVLYLGGLSATKGLAIAQGLADTLVGPGLEEVAPDRVPTLMAEHDVVLVPSRVEGFGLTAAEATAAGRWVVATATGGLVDVIEDGVTGTLVTDGDYRSALAAVPDYDPWQVAERAARFDISRSRAAMNQAWTEVFAARSASTGR